MTPEVNRVFHAVSGQLAQLLAEDCIETWRIFATADLAGISEHQVLYARRVVGHLEALRDDWVLEQMEASVAGEDRLVDEGHEFN